MAPNTILVAAACVAFILYAIQRRLRRSKLPPGPPGVPFLGNLLQAPKSSSWIKFQEWTRKYGPLISVDFGGTIVILIGDYDIAKELLDKRATTYSARPRMVMASELMSNGQHILLRQPNARYVLHQRIEAPVFSPRAAPSYEPVQDMESKVLLYNLLGSNDVKKNFGIYTASVAYMLMHGFRIITNDEWQVHTAREGLDRFVHAAKPGSWLVDSIPLLKALPTFMAPFKQYATAHYQSLTNLYMHNMKQGMETKSWNWTKDLSAAKEAKQMSEEELAWNVGVMQDAAVETSDVFLQTFILACVAQPDFIETAQKEIDEVIGYDGLRMPDFPDLDRLPYVHAIFEEVFRWRHIIPAGFPHAASKDDWYNGYLIPKGAIVIPLWKAMREDNKRYESPAEFRPDRWLGVKGQVNNWGYGRRICAGRHIAKKTILIAIARVLWAFNVRPADRKKVVVDESMFTGGFVSHPTGFDVVFEARSEMHKTLIEDAYHSVEKDPDSVMADVWDLQVKSGLRPRST